MNTPTSFFSLPFPFQSMITVLSDRTGADSDRCAQAADAKATFGRRQFFGTDSHGTTESIKQPAVAD